MAGRTRGYGPPIEAGPIAASLSIVEGIANKMSARYGVNPRASNKDNAAIDSEPSTYCSAGLTVPKIYSTAHMAERARGYGPTIEAGPIVATLSCEIVGWLLWVQLR